jgi:hypothetical protein
MKRSQSDATPGAPTHALPRMMIGFIVRRCAVDLGHQPTASEFATWANAQGDEQSRHLFGRAISEREADIILKHQARLVSAKSARPDEEYVPSDDAALPRGGNVIALADARLKMRAKRRSR